MPRRKACPNRYPLSKDFEAPCILWLNHKGLCETWLPDVIGKNYQVLWDPSYPAIVASVTADMEVDYEARKGRA